MASEPRVAAIVPARSSPRTWTERVLPGRLGRKVLAALVIGLVPASLLLLVLGTTIYRAQLNRERALISEQVSQLLRLSLENAMLKRDIPGIRDIVTRFGQQPGVASVRIVNPAREVRFASDPAQLNRHLSFGDLLCPSCGTAGVGQMSAATELISAAGQPSILRAVTPVRNRAACRECHGPAETHPVNGILVVDHWANDLRSVAMRDALMLAGGGLAMILLSLASVWVALRRQILEPIAAIDTASRRLAGGDLAARVGPGSARDDEIGDLRASFDSMAATLEHSLVETRSHEAFLKSLLDTVPDGVRVIDDRFNIIMANRAYERQVMAGAGPVVGIACYRTHGRDSPCPPTLETCPFHHAELDGPPVRYVHRHLRGDGSDLHVETMAARVSVVSGGQRKEVVIEAMRDLEQQVRYSQEQRMSEIGQLAAGVAHEIYNPLASVRLGLQAMLRRSDLADRLDRETIGFVELVDGEVQKCIDVTKRLLDLSQVPSSDAQLVSFSTIIPEVASLLRYEAERRNVAVETDLGAHDLRVIATNSEARMVVLNLAQNAFHAMAAGGALKISGTHDGREVAIRFADTGVGITPDALAHIFDPFYSRRADGVNGTGLGLTICRAIITRYDGRIDVETEVGRGTTFTVVFPAADRSDDAP